MRRLVILTAILAAVIPASTASAVALPSVLGSCGDQTLARPFVPWLDPAQYMLAPNGDLESDGAWRLHGGARSVAGNETFSVGGASDRRSLALPAGSSATTGWMCVGLEHPTLRLFARNNGPALSTLRVDVVFRDVFGVIRALPVSIVAGGRGWRPDAPDCVSGERPRRAAAPGRALGRRVPLRASVARRLLADRRRVRRSVQGSLSSSTAGNSDSASIVTAPSEATSRPRVTSTASASPAACAPVMS